MNNEYELVEYRNQLAFLARAWRKELKTDKKSPKTILAYWRSSKRFIAGIYQFASKYEQTITEEIN